MSSTTADDAFMAKEISFFKKELRRAALALRTEITLSIKHQAKLHPKRRPRVPVFSIAAVNFLRRECSGINYQDAIVDSLPQVLEKLLIAKSGPLPPGTLPVFRKGLLIDPTSDGTLRTEIGKFFGDIVDYCNNAFRVTGEIPRLPISYMMSLVHFRQRFRANPNDDDLEIVKTIPVVMQKHLSYAFKHNIPKDYVERGSVIFNF